MAAPTKHQVSIVTPSQKNTSTLKAFDDELKRFGWSADAQWPIYHADDDPAQLQPAVQSAVDNAAAALGAGLKGVVVVGGTNATKMAQDYAYSKHLINTLPIIQAVGGAIPSDLQPNVTGFLIDDETISKQHLARLAGLGMTTVTVLYDDGNPPSHYAWGALQLYQGYYFNGVTLNPINYSQLANIRGSFMLLPNATFYYNTSTIATAVENSMVPYAIYPEREYKKAHGKAKRAGKIMHGHDVSLTYRLAARYVDSILDGSMTLDNLPAFGKAVTDVDPES